MLSTKPSKCKGSLQQPRPLQWRIETDEFFERQYESKVLNMTDKAIVDVSAPHLSLGCCLVGSFCLFLEAEGVFLFSHQPSK